MPAGVAARHVVETPVAGGSDSCMFVSARKGQRAPESKSDRPGVNQWNAYRNVFFPILINYLPTSTELGKTKKVFWNRNQYYSYRRNISMNNYVSRPCKAEAVFGHTPPLYGNTKAIEYRSSAFDLCGCDVERQPLPIKSGRLNN